MYRRDERKNQKKVLTSKVTGAVDVAESVVGEVTSGAEKAARPFHSRYPTLFMLLATFGFVATLYGFEGIIDTIPFLADRPVIIFVTGFIILVATGTLYKKLK